MIPADVEKLAVVRERAPEYMAVRTKTTALLPCPVGISSYKKVSRECYYVDRLC
jgi:hypothetical protein